MRTVTYFDDDVKEWFGVEWSDIVSGTQIRIYEEDGTPVTDGTGVHELFTDSDAYQQTISGEEGIWTVNIFDPNPFTTPKQE